MAAKLFILLWREVVMAQHLATVTSFTRVHFANGVILEAMMIEIGPCNAALQVEGAIVQDVAGEPAQSRNGVSVAAFANGAIRLQEQ